MIRWVVQLTRMKISNEVPGLRFVYCDPEIGILSFMPIERAHSLSDCRCRRCRRCRRCCRCHWCRRCRCCQCCRHCWRFLVVVVVVRAKRCQHQLVEPRRRKQKISIKIKCSGPIFCSLYFWQKNDKRTILGTYDSSIKLEIKKYIENYQVKIRSFKASVNEFLIWNVTNFAKSTKQVIRRYLSKQYGI